MIKSISMLLLAGVSNGVMAEEWVAISHTYDGGIIVYANQSTIRKEGNIINIWTLGDFKKAEKTGDNRIVLSLKEQYEYDCKVKQMRRLFATMHSENMGRGDVVLSRTIHEEWQLVPPGSMNEQLWEFACGKK